MTECDYQIIKALRGFGEMERELTRHDAFGRELVSAHWGAWMLSAYMKREKIEESEQAALYGSKGLTEDAPYGDAW